jgi:hypothetical protein
MRGLEPIYAIPPPLLCGLTANARLVAGENPIFQDMSPIPGIIDDGPLVCSNKSSVCDERAGVRQPTENVLRQWQQCEQRGSRRVGVRVR